MYRPAVERGGIAERNTRRMITGCCLLVHAGGSSRHQLVPESP